MVLYKILNKTICVFLYVRHYSYLLALLIARLMTLFCATPPELAVNALDDPVPIENPPGCGATLLVAGEPKLNPPLIAPRMNIKTF